MKNETIEPNKPDFKSIMIEKTIEKTMEKTVNDKEKMSEIAEALNISSEIVEKTLKELHMTIEDLKEPKNLLKFVMTIMRIPNMGNALISKEVMEMYKKIEDVISK